MTALEMVVDAPQRTAQKSYSWRRHDVAADMAAMDSMSAGATAADRFLSNHAWANPDGSLTVKMRVLVARCALWGYTVEQTEAIWLELKGSDRWVRSSDRKVLKAVWMQSLREPLVELSAKRSHAGKESGKVRKAKAAPKKRVRTRVARPDIAPVTEESKSLKDNAVNMCSTRVEQKEREKERERTTTPTDPSGLSGGVVVPASPGGDGASAPAASHAVGAAGAVAMAVPELGRVATAWLRDSERDIAATTPPIDWRTADVEQLVIALAVPDTGVDVERALYRLCAAQQRVPGDDEHLPLLHEVRSLLEGAEGRAGLLEPALAPRSLALALHGANAMPDAKVSPVVLRALAVGIRRELEKQPADAEPQRVAMLVAYEIHFGKRKAFGYSLPCDGLRAPSRLLGHVTRQEVAA